MLKAAADEITDYPDVAMQTRLHAAALTLLVSLGPDDFKDRPVEDRELFARIMNQLTDAKEEPHVEVELTDEQADALAADILALRSRFPD